MRSSAKSKIHGLYIIFDPEFTGGRGIEEVAGGALEGGARVVQLRAKGLSVRDLYPIAVKARELTRKAGAVFIVNDSVELALASKADGVHLGQDDFPLDAARRVLGPDKIIGISTHNAHEAVAAEAGGADYIGFGPMYKTPTKDSGTPKGPEGIRAIRDKIRIPIAAIGGINASNSRAVIEAGADAVAVITAVTLADDIKKAAESISLFF